MNLRIELRPPRVIPLLNLGTVTFAVTVLSVITATSRLAFAEGPVEKSFEAKGVKIHYLLSGRGEPVVLIHGLHSSARINWQLPGAIERLARDHQVIALDLPGHGGSDKPERADAYGKAMSDDVGLLLDHLEIKQAHIVGYSLGGMVAARFTVEHPQRVISTTLGGMGWLRDGSRLQQFWERIPERDGGRTPPACLREIGKLALTEEEVRGIKAPVRIIVGDRDPVRRMYVTPLQDVRPDWKVIEIEGAGHLNCIMKPQFAEAIVEWVGQNAVK